MSQKASNEISSGDRRGCPACGSKTGITHQLPYKTVCSDGRLLNHGTCVIQCKKCDSYFKELSPDWLKKTNELYNSSYRSNYYDSESGRDPRSIDIIDFIETTQGGKHRIESISRTLDYGTGNGVFPLTLLRRYPHLQITGYDKYAHQQSKGLSEFPTYSFSNRQADLRRYDLVTSIQVFEHIHDPIGELNALADTVAEDGHFYINIPDTFANPVDLVVYDHCNHFSRLGLKLLFNRSQFAKHQCLPEGRITISPFRSKESIIWRGGQEEIDETANNCDSIHMPDPITCLSDFAERINEVSCMSDCVYVFGSAYASTWARSLIPRGCKSRYLHSWDGVSGIDSIKELKKKSQKERSRISVVIPFPRWQAGKIAAQIGDDINCIWL